MSLLTLPIIDNEIPDNIFIKYLDTIDKILQNWKGNWKLTQNKINVSLIFVGNNIITWVAPQHSSFE